MTEVEHIPGVGPAAAKKLRENNVPCAEVLAFMDPYKLCQKTKLGEGTSIKIIKNARDLLGLSGIKNGLERDEEWKGRKRLTTGVTALDKQLLGGIEVGSIVELYGAARSGKSQWCHQLAVTAQLPQERGGLETNVLWLDTEDSFRSLTLRANAIRMGLDPEKVLSKVHTMSILSRDHFLKTVEQIPTLVHTLDASVIIIDNLGMFFRPDTEGMAFHRILSASLAEVFDILRGLTRTLGCIVILTNQVFHKIMVYGGNPNAPVGDHIMAHAATYRFYVRHKRETTRGIVLKDNAGLPEFSLEVELDWGGFYGSRNERRAVGPVIKDYLGTLDEYSGLMGRDEVSEEGVG